jgi:hypothetical protein
MPAAASLITCAPVVGSQAEVALNDRACALVAGNRCAASANAVLKNRSVVRLNIEVFS